MRRLNKLTAAVLALTATMIFTSCAEDEVSEEVKALRQAQVDQQEAIADERRAQADAEAAAQALAEQGSEDDLLTDSLAEAQLVAQAQQDLEEKLKDIDAEVASDLADYFDEWADAVAATNGFEVAEDNKEKEIADKQEEITEKEAEIASPEVVFTYTGVEVAQSGGEDVDGNSCDFCPDYSGNDGDVDALELAQLEETRDAVKAKFTLYSAAVAAINALETQYFAIDEDSVTSVVAGEGVGEKEDAIEKAEEVNDFIDSLEFAGTGVATPADITTVSGAYATAAAFDAITDAILEALANPASTGITAENIAADDDVNAFNAAVTAANAANGELADVSALEDQLVVLQNALAALQGDLQEIQVDLANAVVDEAARKAIYDAAKADAGL